MRSCKIKVWFLNTTCSNNYTRTRARFEDACLVLYTADRAVSDLLRARRTAVFYPLSFSITTGLWAGCPLGPLCCQIFLVWHCLRKWKNTRNSYMCLCEGLVFQHSNWTTDKILADNWQMTPFLLTAVEIKIDYHDYHYCYFISQCRRNAEFV